MDWVTPEWWDVDLSGNHSRPPQKPVCVPLCSASKAYGRYDKPWLHEAQCPVRLAWLAERAELSSEEGS